MIELEPKNERNFYKRFRVFLSKRKYAEAIKDLSRALELKPKYKQVRARERACEVNYGLCAMYVGVHTKPAENYVCSEMSSPRGER